MAEKHGHRQAQFDFAVDVRALPSGQAVAQLRDTTQVNLDPQRFAEINKKNLLYQGGVVSPGNYHLKFVARENESGKIGTFEQNLNVPAAQPGKMTLSSVPPSSQLVPVQKTSEVQTKGQGLRAKLVSSPLVVNGETIVPSVTRLFMQDQTLYVFFQAYYPQNSSNKATLDPSTLRAGLIFFRNRPASEHHAAALRQPKWTQKNTPQPFASACLSLNYKAGVTPCKPSSSLPAPNIRLPPRVPRAVIQAARSVSSARASGRYGRSGKYTARERSAQASVTVRTLHARARRTTNPRATP